MKIKGYEGNKVDKEIKYCFGCPFREYYTYCKYYGRYFIKEDTAIPKPDWCKVCRIIVEENKKKEVILNERREILL